MTLLETESLGFFELNSRLLRVLEEVGTLCETLEISEGQSPESSLKVLLELLLLLSVLTVPKLLLNS